MLRLRARAATWIATGHAGQWAIVRAASAVYALATQLHWWSWHGIRRPRTLPGKVWSVGNLTWGGTGKTPMVAHLANIAAQDMSSHPVILTRGYHGGDEARWLSSACPDATVAVGRNRHATAAAALACIPPALSRAAVFILDDGLQHHALARDVNFVMVNALSPFGPEPPGVLPAGTLRERPTDALERCDVVVLHNAGIATRAQRQRACAAIRSCSGARRIPVLYATAVPHAFTLVTAAPHRQSIALKDARCRYSALLGLSGVGCPAAFYKTLRWAGADVRHATSLPTAAVSHVDHHHFTARELRDAGREADRHKAALVLTEKDYHRCAALLHAFAATTDTPVLLLQTVLRVSRIPREYLPV